MEFIEAPSFTKHIGEFLDDVEYGRLQYALTLYVTAGALIPGGGGLRKLRWKDPSRQKGKRSGIRMIYYVHVHDRVYFLHIYDKNKEGDLSCGQLKTLRSYIKEGVL